MQDVERPAAWMPRSQHEAEYRKTVYCTSRHTNIAIRGGSLAVGTEKHAQSIPLALMDRIIFIGPPHCEASVVYQAVKHNVAVEFLDSFAHPQGLTLPLQHHLPSFHEQQNAFAQSPESRFALATAYVRAKIMNCEVVLRNRDVRSADMAAIHNALHPGSPPHSWESLRGYEGAAAKTYFACLSELVAPFVFSGRKTRPAPDPVNSMLSFGYVLLHNRLAAALLRAGLNPRAGFYHSSRGKHFALASDLMEDVRFVVDRMVLGLIRKRILTPDDFTVKSGRCSFAKKDAYSRYLAEFERHMTREFDSPVDREDAPVGTRMTLNQWLDATARSYARHISRQTPLVPFRAR